MRNRRISAAAVLARIALSPDGSTRLGQLGVAAGRIAA